MDHSMSNPIMLEKCFSGFGGKGKNSSWYILNASPLNGRGFTIHREQNLLLYMEGYSVAQIA